MSNYPHSAMDDLFRTQPGSPASIEEAVNKVLSRSGSLFTARVVDGGSLTSESPYAELVPAYTRKKPNLWQRLRRKPGLIVQNGLRVSPGMAEFIVAMEPLAANLPADVFEVMRRAINLTRPTGSMFLGFRFVSVAL